MTYSVDKSDEEWRAELGPRAVRGAARGRRPSARGPASCSTRAAPGSTRAPPAAPSCSRAARSSTRTAAGRASTSRCAPRPSSCIEDSSARHAAHRGALRDVRLAPRPRLPGRRRHAHRRPLLHELDRARVHPRSRRMTGALEAVRDAPLVVEGDGCRAHARRAADAASRPPGRVADHSSMRPWRLIELRGTRPRAPRSRDQQGERRQGLVVQAAARAAADRGRRQLPQERQGAALGAGGGRLGRRARAEPAAGRSRLGRHLAHRPLHAQQGRREGCTASARTRSCSAGCTSAASRRERASGGARPSTRGTTSRGCPPPSRDFAQPSRCSPSARSRRHGTVATTTDSSATSDHRELLHEARARRRRPQRVEGERHAASWPTTAPSPSSSTPVCATSAADRKM